jgi:CRP/FNR family transcriptional regulator
MLPPKQVLSRCEFLRGLSPKWIGVLAENAVEHSYLRGERIFTQGQECPGMFIVGRGLVRVYKVGSTGKEHVLHLAAPGQTFAEIAVIGGFECPANAEAAEDCEVVCLPREFLQGLLQREHELCLQLLSSMALWVRQLIGLLEDIVLRDATARVASHLLHAAEGKDVFVLKMLKKDLASHLNLTSETFSRSLRRLTESGAIELTDGSKVTLLSRETLAGFSAPDSP